jgi:hypothetical protein
MSKGKSDKSYDELVRALGRPTAEKISIELGGQRIYFGVRTEVDLVKDDWIIKSIGLTLTKKLFLENEELVLWISQKGSIKARNRMVRKFISAGWTNKQAARAVGLSERAILQIIKPLDNLA